MSCDYLSCCTMNTPDETTLLNNLRKSERMMANAERIGHFGCWEFDMADTSKLEGNALRWSDEVFRIFGYEPGAIEVTIENFYAGVHPDDLERVKELSLKAFQTFTPVSYEHRVIRPDGSMRWVREGALVSKDMVSGDVLYVTGTVQDITELKLAELQRLEAAQALVSRNTDLERLGFIVSHDLRAPLATILGLGSLLQEEDLDPATERECIDGLIFSIRQIDETITGLVTIFDKSSSRTEARTLVRFAETLSNTVQVLGLRPVDITITTDFTAVDGTTTLKSHLHSIFQNLITNSIKYCRPDVPAAMHIKSAVTPSHITLSFADNGLGIDLEQHSDALFGMHKRFHKHVAGSGIGLYMVKTQVEALGGHITVRSEVNQGTEFIIGFPI